MKTFRVHLERRCHGSGSWNEEAYVDVDANDKEAAIVAAKQQVQPDDWEIEPHGGSDLICLDPGDPTAARCWEVAPSKDLSFKRYWQGGD